MWRYLELLSFEPLTTIQSWKEQVAGGRNPRDIKVALALEIITRFHDRTQAEAALADFEARFRGNAIPEDIPEVLLETAGEGILLSQAMKQANLVSSTSDALRQVDGGGVRLDSEKVSDRGLKLAAGTTAVLQVGKRKFARITVR
jgi:tyrosyl-tRNA synthetase